MRYAFDRSARLRGLALALGLSVCISTTTSADDADVMTLVDPEHFSEKFSGNTQVSGQLLSGLTYESDSTPLDPSRIAIANSVYRACVRMITEDGRYWSNNLFQSHSKHQNPLYLSFPTSYTSQLKTYPASGLLILAYMADDCENVHESPLIPGIVNGLQKNSRLFAFINVSQGRSAAWLEKDGTSATERTDCIRPTDGARVTYSAICAISINRGLTPGEYTLRISVQSLTGARAQEHYNVILE